LNTQHAFRRRSRLVNHRELKADAKDNVFQNVEYLEKKFLAVYEMGEREL